MPALLDLVRKLIDYGRELAATLHQRVAEQPYFAVFNYATNDLALVLARITRGLLRAQALEARLIRLAARPQRQRAQAKPTSSRSRPASRPAQDGDLLANMPTAEQIAAEVRRRPIGAVIVDICRDLAILPSHPLWRQIQTAISNHGGSYIRLLKHVIGRFRRAAELIVPPEPPPQLFLPASAGTGPP